MVGNWFYIILFLLGPSNLVVFSNNLQKWVN